MMPRRKRLGGSRLEGLKPDRQRTVSPHGRYAPEAILPLAPSPQVSKPPSRRAAGFSLMEVMFAIAILALGLIAIASLFPVGLIQQKKALDDSMGVVIGNNAIAMLQAADKPRLLNLLGITAYQDTFAPLPAEPSWLHYNDPSGSYDYKLAYRLANDGNAFSINTSSPLEIAVFVYRTNSTKAGAANVGPDLGVWTTVGVTAAGDMDPLVGSANGPGERNQVVLASVGTTNRSYVLNVVQVIGVDVNKYPTKSKVSPPPREATDRVVFLPQKAVAIVTGVVR